MEESKQNKIVLLRQMIENAERNVSAARQILQQLDDTTKRTASDSETSQIIEGSFDGEKMIGLDGKTYPIPPNYASKSKLVDGDLLKLTITEDGSFLYKQISPIDRRKIVGTVMRDEKDKFYVSSEGRKYKVLLASLTYFKAEEGDEVTLVVPKDKISKWAAVEAVMENSGNGFASDNIGEPLALDNNNDEKESDIYQENDRKKTIEDEWTPDFDDIKNEIELNEERTDKISDNL